MAGISIFSLENTTFDTLFRSTNKQPPASPRRKELLTRCGLAFEIQPSTVAEEAIDGELPVDAVRRLALLKASDIASTFPHAWVLGADTVVAIDGKILGKPADQADAAHMLSTLQGKTHTVWGGIALVNASKGVEHVESYGTKVVLLPLSAQVIERYIQSGEPADKAGAYAIQGLGAQFVSTIEGSYTNVVGLNIAAVISLLKQFKVIDESA
ncbi:Maf family protein [Oligoflexia bacterium]|nr:Maf family protein [Oligoflexia bacterium]